MNVEIISKEIVVPSSPTPHHQRHLNLSFLDQIAPKIHVPLIFFYQHDDQLNIDNHVEISRKLKQSLSHILTLFPPLAGRIQDNTHIDCNDAGVEFIEAQVHTSLTQLIKEPNMDELQQLLPVMPLDRTKNNAKILYVKLNFFTCGGIAIAVCLSHKIADGSSMVSFVNAWAASCRGEDSKVIQYSPTFNLASYFPPRDLPSSGISPNVGVTNEKIRTKRLVFNMEKLAKLKQVVASSSEVKNPTRAEAVSAFIWNHFNEVARTKTDTKKTSFAAVHAVNLRPRAIPPIPINTFGNCWRPAIAILSKTGGSVGDPVSKLRYAIREVNDDYIRKLQKEDCLKDLSKLIDFFKNGVEICNFSSWCRFPMYEVDFGWRKPVWVCTTTLPIKNLVILMSSPVEDGIEAWVNVLDHDLKLLENTFEQLNIIKS